MTGGGPAVAAAPAYPAAARTGAPAGLLLAAGAGRRFGGPKALARYGGETLAGRGARLLADAGCAPVVVVLGAAADEVRAALHSSQPGLPETVVAADWESGMGASLRVGLAALDGRAPACVVALADQPLVTPAAVDRLTAAWRGGATAAVAAYRGAARNPVLLDASVWSAVAEAAVGDAGARGWLRAHPELVTAVECGDVASADDVDTPEMLAALPPVPPPAVT